MHVQIAKISMMSCPHAAIFMIILAFVLSNSSASLRLNTFCGINAFLLRQLAFALDTMERDTRPMSNTFGDYAGNEMWIMNNHIYNEIHIAHLTSANLALHDLSYGRATWIVRSDCTRSSDEVMVQGQPVRRSTQTTLCRCRQCDWSWFLRGWRCWHNEVCIVPLTDIYLALHDLITGEDIWDVPYENSNSSDKLVEYEISSVSIETVLTEPTETNLRISWNRSGVSPCGCGRCELHWFRYGWKCWPVRG